MRTKTNITRKAKRKALREAGKVGKKHKVIEVEGRRSHFREMPNGSRLPVIDVRDNEKSRVAVNNIIKAENVARGSRFINQSFSLKGYSYNQSMRGIK